MPLFSRNGLGGLISQKKPRQGQQNVATPQPNNLDPVSLENGAIKVKLGHNVLCYEDGLWTSEVGGSSGNTLKEITRIKKHNIQLAEENNLLKYKINVLLDMLAVSNADYVLKDNELEYQRKHKQSCDK
ncbi:uncharacterized protein TRIADDRAFT_53092 [Trichoplax adhaerens]|uniref:Uncharacterized protein n=1 Tax=Trichoplax adhaerens TaxID=10228 RepID=B3RNA1_TRIAD|nr:hypothetical protein TRIADDRAFT_53092 [Trichoplax adhaerens]EDV27417.1 hypothetical protein TRIADDRAFT_53092 [Trichoplax adhaerens]|eukprot:XP_002109251.1 hypothetical protein TRIADDRAFT_53092 [Trichoplax adhaerens]